MVDALASGASGGNSVEARAACGGSQGNLSDYQLVDSMKVSGSQNATKSI